MTAPIRRTRVAAPIAEKTGHGLERARFERLTEDIAWTATSVALPRILFEHNRFAHGLL
jgi:hypothetical protein